MAIDNDTVKRIAFLSRLKVEDDKIDATKEEFNKILNWIEELNEVNTDDIEPLISVNDSQLRLREDNVMAGNCREDILANAPMSEFDYFAVPKVVE
jgi:aspartyl-tRNA(Asn)/glutamyl-tRNA(Gln) amidotransferase subunit C